MKTVNYLQIQPFHKGIIPNTTNKKLCQAGSVAVMSSLCKGQCFLRQMGKGKMALCGVDLVVEPCGIFSQSAEFHKLQ